MERGRNGSGVTVEEFCECIDFNSDDFLSCGVEASVFYEMTELLFDCGCWWQQCLSFFALQFGSEQVEEVQSDSELLFHEPHPFVFVDEQDGAGCDGSCLKGEVRCCAEEVVGLKDGWCSELFADLVDAVGCCLGDEAVALCDDVECLAGLIFVYDGLFFADLLELQPCVSHEFGELQMAKPFE